MVLGPVECQPVLLPVLQIHATNQTSCLWSLHFLTGCSDWNGPYDSASAGRGCDLNGQQSTVKQKERDYTGTEPSCPGIIYLLHWNTENQYDQLQNFKGTVSIGTVLLQCWYSIGQVQL